ncbi:hypothetical protein [Streptomyces sp. S.PB5]|nr:hypothetical protein [Streptomyces sp. S.PB5]MDN3029540.1 hypothetical protein [Streptomyces sp. S.PB5]
MVTSDWWAESTQDDLDPGLHTPAERDRLRARHADWLSEHPGGF